MSARLDCPPVTPKRVVSVSAHHAAAIAACSPLVADSHAIAPVIDDRAEWLRELMRDTDSAATRAQHTLAHLAQEQTHAHETLLQLQERLRVSARMLQASQSQIVQMENCVAILETRQHQAEAVMAAADGHLADFEAHADASVHRLANRLQELMDGAVARFEQSVQERQESLRGSDQRFAEMRRSLDQDVAAVVDSMRGMVDRIEQIASSAQRSSQGSPAMRRDQGDNGGLDIAGALNRPASAAEPAPPLRLQKWGGGG